MAHGQDPESVASQGSHCNKERQPSRKAENGFPGKRGNRIVWRVGTTQPSKSLAGDTECSLEAEPEDKLQSSYIVSLRNKQTTLPKGVSCLKTTTKVGSASISVTRLGSISTQNKY